MQGVKRAMAHSFHQFLREPLIHCQSGAERFDVLWKVPARGNLRLSITAGRLVAITSAHRSSVPALSAGFNQSSMARNRVEMRRASG